MLVVKKGKLKELIKHGFEKKGTPQNKNYQGCEFYERELDCDIVIQATETEITICNRLLGDYDDDLDFLYDLIKSGVIVKR